MKDIEVAALIAALILFALLACGAVSLIAIFLIPDAQAPAGPDGGGPGPVVPVPNETGPDQPEISEQDLVIWSKITNPNVEAICLQKAKEEAGENSGLVYGCTCDEIEKADIKTYRCDISTADPFTAYFANIDCYLARRECDIETNYGSQIVSFDQLGELG